jgi:RHS repeat-associated protein
MIAAALCTVTADPALAAPAPAVPAGPRPNATRLDFPLNAGVDATVDVGTGNLLVTTTDLTLPGVAKDVQLGLDFNSLLLASGSTLPAGTGGPGWAMRLGADTRLVSRSDATVLYLAPDGLQGVYTPVAGTSGYTTPAGFKNTLVKLSGGGWTLTDHATSAVSTFDTAGTLTKITDRNGNATTFSYTAGTLSAIASTRGGPGSRTANVTFSSGKVTKLSQQGDTGGSRSVTYGYDASGRLSSLTNAVGDVTTLTWDPATGDLAALGDGSSTVVSFTYDSAHRVTSVSRGNTTRPSVTRFSYPSGTSTLVAEPDTDQSQPVSSVPHTSYTLDATDRVAGAVDPLGRSRQATYTPFADVASTTSPAGHVTSTTHTDNSGESLNGVTSPTGATVTIGYGNPATPYLPANATDAQGNQSVVTYDGAGNPATSTNSGTGAVAKVSYRSDGTLASATDPKGNATSYAEDSATKQITSATPPAGSGLGASTYTWDGYGRLASVTNGAGDTTSYTYTDTDQIAQIAFSDGTPAISYDYNSSGYLRTRTDGSGTLTYTYDALDRLLERTATSGGGTLGYGYDATGNLTSSTNGQGSTAYTYDAANQLTSMTTPDGTTTAFGYDSDGRRADTWWKTNTDHTTFAAHTHIGFAYTGKIQRTTTSRNSDDTNLVFDTTYCYTPMTGTSCANSTPTYHPAGGLIVWSIDRLTGARSDYTYDAANRLTQVTNYHGHTYAYGYDANGNRTTTTIDGTNTQSLTFNTGNQITNTGYHFNTAGQQNHAPDQGVLTYNAAGQMTSQDSSTTNTTYTWAGPGMDELLSTTVTGGDTYGYVYGRNDANGEPLIDSVTKNTTTAYINHDPTGTPVSIDPAGGQPSYYVTDGQGSIVALVGSDGTVTGTYTYDPYGTITAQTGTGTATDLNPYRYTAGLIDRGTGFLKHGTRFNDTTTGRWTTPDPITHLNNPDEANPYQYAADNPVNFVDPTGSISLQGTLATIGIAVGFAAGGLLAAAACVGVVGCLVLGALAGGTFGALGGGVGGLLGGADYADTADNLFYGGLGGTLGALFP